MLVRGPNQTAYASSRKVWHRVPRVICVHLLNVKRLTLLVDLTEASC